MSWRGRSEWDEWEYSRPRRPADGIKAQTQRGKFGATWWAGRWLAALEQLVDAGRLSRGRSYARSGQVTKLDVGPKGIDARVQGSRPTPYRVTVRFRQLSDADWNAVADAMAAEAIYAARLLSGEMPEQIEEAFHAAGATLFPSQEGDMTTECTCPDWSNPCKHVAAVFYLLGERFDADPFLMFVLRGRTKEAIVEALRARRAAGAATDETTAIDGAPPPSGEPPDQEDDEPPVPLLPAGAGAAAGAGGVAAAAGAAGAVQAEAGAAAVASAVEAFWSAPPALAEVSIAFRAPAVDALPVKLRGPLPLRRDGEEATAAAVEEVYRAIGERALRLATEGA